MPNNLMKTLALTILGLSCLWVSCRTKAEPQSVLKDDLEPFIFDALAMMPIQATEMGYHEHVHHVAEGKTEGTQTPLDPLLDDYSPDAVKKRAQFFKDFQKKLHDDVHREELAGDAFADFSVADNFIGRTLFELDEVKTHEHNPGLYVQLLGRALYNPLLIEYADKPTRFHHIIARLQKVPEFLNQAKQNLQSSPTVWTQTARAENDGLIHLVDRILAAEVPAELKGDYTQAAQPALAALRDFNDYLDKDLAKRNQYDWRLGGDLYAKKLHLYTGGSDKTPDQLLAEAEAEFQKLQQEMIDTARPIHHDIYGNQRAPSDVALITDVLDVVSDEKRLASGAGLVDQIKKDIDEAKSFVEAQELAPAPPSNNLEVIETPEFLRSSHPVAYFIGAPPLEPKLAALFMMTPIPSDWPRARELSKLREYNLPQLMLLTVEYSIPGYYTAREFGNMAEPLYRRVLRALGNPSYIDGWGTYITDTAVSAGLKGGNEIKVIFIKEKMRIVTDAIIDIRMHTKNMSEADAMDLLRQKAYQEVEGARDRIQRAELTSAQLPLAYYGWKEWLRVREHYQTNTQDFSLRSFHEKALRAGPMAFPDLGYVTSQIPMK